MSVSKLRPAILAGVLSFQIAISTDTLAQAPDLPDSDPKFASKLDNLLRRTRAKIARAMESFQKKQEKLLLKAQVKRSTLCTFRRGDLNLDHLVNTQDVQLVQGCVGDNLSPLCLITDLNLDGFTSIGDLTVIQQNMGRDPLGDCTIPAPSPTPGG